MKKQIKLSDCFLFPILKTAIKGEFYNDILAILAAVIQNILIDDIKESMPIKVA